MPILPIELVATSCEPMKNRLSTGELRQKFPIRIVVFSSWTSQRRMRVSRAMARSVHSFELGFSKLGMSEFGLGMVIWPVILEDVGCAELADIEVFADCQLVFVLLGLRLEFIEVI